MIESILEFLSVDYCLCITVLISIATIVCVCVRVRVRVRLSACVEWVWMLFYNCMLFIVGQ